jgi:transcriptional regulator with XRE-family HTH domain
LSTEPTTDEALGERVGARIRARRTELGKKLAEVAADAGLSVSYISSIEKGGKVPSLPVLARLAHALDISLTEILRSSASTRMAQGSLSHELGQERLNADGSPLDIVRLSTEPGAKGIAPVAFERSDVFVFVYRGHLTLEVDGATYELEPGDALHGARPRTITWAATGGDSTTSLWAAAPRHRPGALES